jgi:hypothetical protein
MMSIRHASFVATALADALGLDPDYDMVVIRCSDEKGDGMAVIHKLR